MRTSSTSQAVPPIFTIGHGGRTPSEVISLLHQERISTLVDVRTQPYSRYQSEFSREPLRLVLERSGVEYLFMGTSLGGRPADEACYVGDRVDYRRVSESEIFRSGVRHLLKCVDAGGRLALLCSEAKPETCHRMKLIGRALVREGLEVLHWDERGELRTQSEILSRLNGGQLGIFADESVLDFSRSGIPRPDSW